MRKIIALLIVIPVMCLFGNLYAKERRGANVEIYKKRPKTKMEGTPREEAILPDIKGELIAVKQSSLLLKDSQSEADVSIDVEDIIDIKIVKKSKTLIGVGLGLLAGAAAGAIVGMVVHEVFIKEDFIWKTQYSALAGLSIGGFTGGLAGGIIGADRSETIQIEGKSESEIRKVLDDLRKKARVPNFQ